MRVFTVVVCLLSLILSNTALNFSNLTDLEGLKKSSLEELKTYIHTRIYTKIFIIALFIIDET